MRKKNFLCFLLLLSSLALIHCQSSGRRAHSGDDYLTAELRARVERVKEELRQQPTSQSNFASRIQLLWDWSNALSLTGVQLNPDLPAEVSPPSSEPDATISPERLKKVDSLLEELRLHDEYPPEAFGALDLNVAAPLQAGTWQTLQQTYTVGDIPLRPGGGILVGRHFQSYPFPSGTNFQVSDPTGEGYVTISSSNPQVHFAPEVIQWRGLHGIAEVGTPPVVFRLKDSALHKGDEVTITYGDTTSGSRGMRIQDYSNDAVPLPIYVDFEGTGNFLFLPLQTYEVVGGPVFGVHGFAPSTVKTGQPFTLSVRSEDVHRNRASGSIPAYEIHLNGRPFQRLEAGTEAITLIKDITFDEAGIYRFTIQSTDGAIQGHANPVWVRAQPDWNIYWGDTHGHSGFAEGLGTADGYFRFGRDEARLDFLTHSEHDAWMDDHEWEILRKNVEDFNTEGEFIAFLGYEWTVSTRVGGHHNVLFRTPVGRKRVPLQTAPVLSQLYQKLAEQNDLEDVLIIPHAHQAGEWRESHPVMERLVEIMSGHGNFEWFGQRYLAFGHQIGFIAASDDHFSHPGYSAPFLYAYTQPNGLAAVRAPEKTSDAIFDALRSRCTYATTGQRMILDVTLNGAIMGSRAEFSPTRTLVGRVMGTAPIDEVTLVKNGHDLESLDFLTAPAGENRWLQVSFWSESDPGIRSNPRSWRRWDGSLMVRGARLEGIRASSISNHVLERVEVDPANPNRIDFSLMTRGSNKSLLLEISAVTSEARVELDLREAPADVQKFYGRLTALGYGSVGILSLTGSAVLRLRDMEQGHVTADFADGTFRDRVTLRRIRSQAPFDQEFEFTDQRDPLPGDNYYVRVRQLDDGVAWSSPIWVGSFSTE